MTQDVRLLYRRLHRVGHTMRNRRDRERDEGYKGIEYNMKPSETLESPAQLKTRSFIFGEKDAQLSPLHITACAYPAQLEPSFPHSEQNVCPTRILLAEAPRGRLTSVDSTVTYLHSPGAVSEGTKLSTRPALPWHSQKDAPYHKFSEEQTLFLVSTLGTDKHHSRRL